MKWSLESASLDSSENYYSLQTASTPCLSDTPCLSPLLAIVNSGLAVSRVHSCDSFVPPSREYNKTRDSFRKCLSQPSTPYPDKIDLPSAKNVANISNDFESTIVRDVKDQRTEYLESAFEPHENVQSCLVGSEDPSNGAERAKRIDKRLTNLQEPSHAEQTSTTVEHADDAVGLTNGTECGTEQTSSAEPWRTSTGHTNNER